MVHTAIGAGAVMGLWSGCVILILGNRSVEFQFKSRILKYFERFGLEENAIQRIWAYSSFLISCIGIGALLALEKSRIDENKTQTIWTFSSFIVSCTVLGALISFATTGLINIHRTKSN